MARFIPDVTDDKHIIPAGAPQLALRASTEHDAFMLDTRTVSAWHIIGLDSPIDDGTTCREAIMKIRSNKTGDRSLFVAAAEMWDGTVRLAFHKDFADEARSVTSGLPLVMAQECGPRA